MISKEDIKKLADLARIYLTEKEILSLQSEIDPILNYVGQIKEVSASYVDQVKIGLIKNVMREDEDPSETASQNHSIINEFPGQKDNYLKVKKIL